MIPNLPDAARHHSWLFLLRGLLALAFGLLTLSVPRATLVLLVAFIAAYALVDGAVTITYAFRMRSIFSRWWVMLIQGLVSAAFGVLAFMRPGLSLLYIVIMVSLWMFVAGMAQFALAQVQRSMGASAAWSIAGGVLSVALAVAAVAFPRLTVLTVLALVAWFALAVGIVQIVVAMRLRTFGKRLASA